MEFDSNLQVLKTQEMQSSEQKKWLQTSPKEPLAHILGTLIHDLNNPLTIFSARSYQLEQLISEPAPNLAKIQEISTSLSTIADQLENQIKKLKIAAKCPSQDRTLTCSTSRLISECVEMIQNHSLGTSIHWQVLDESPNLELAIKPLHFQQALLHLLLNAAEAEGIQSKSIQIQSITLNHHWLVRVSNSQGSPFSHPVEKVFQPFFTTKVGHQGLGVSLAQVLIENMGGSLELQSTFPLWVMQIQLPL